MLPRGINKCRPDIYVVYIRRTHPFSFRIISTQFLVYVVCVINYDHDRVSVSVSCTYIHIIFGYGWNTDEMSRPTQEAVVWPDFLICVGHKYWQNISESRIFIEKWKYKYIFLFLMKLLRVAELIIIHYNDTLFLLPPTPTMRWDKLCPVLTY